MSACVDACEHVAGIIGKVVVCRCNELVRINLNSVYKLTNESVVAIVDVLADSAESFVLANCPYVADMILDTGLSNSVR